MSKFGSGYAKNLGKQKKRPKQRHIFIRLNRSSTTDYSLTSKNAYVDSSIVCTEVKHLKANRLTPRNIPLYHDQRQNQTASEHHSGKDTTRSSASSMWLHTGELKFKPYSHRSACCRPWLDYCKAVQRHLAWGILHRPQNHPLIIPTE